MSAFIAIALSPMGRFDEALKAVDESFSFIDRTGQHYYEAELHRLKGELLLARDPSDGGPAGRCSAPPSKLRVSSKRVPGGCAQQQASHDLREAPNWWVRRELF